MTKLLSVLFLVVCLFLVDGKRFLRDEERRAQAGSGSPLADPIANQIDQEVNKVVKITSGLKRIGGPGMVGIPGGWSSADVKSKEVVAVANWAAEKLYPGLHPSPKVTTAMTQVVAGLNYNLTLATTRLVKVGGTATTCSVTSIAVWDRFGTYNLMKNFTMSTRCN